MNLTITVVALKLARIGSNSLAAPVSLLGVERDSTPRLVYLLP